MNTWHSQITSSDQGLVIEDETGRNVAVVYDPKDTTIITAAPELLEFVNDIVRYLESGPISSKSDRKWVINRAETLITKAKGE